MKAIISFLALFLLSLNTFPHVQFAQTETEFILTHYEKYEYEIPMRDGVKLFTSVYVPKAEGIYPIMMNRTPYNVAPYGKGYKTSLGPSSLFSHDLYIFVYQDVRGRWMSGGVFQEMTPELDIHTKKNEVDESTDTYDSIDWLIKHVKKNSGKVGVWGISYPGFYSTTSLISRHPALTCVSPQAPIADLYRDDAFHNGAFMLVANFGFYPFFTNRQDNKPTQRPGIDFNLPTNDGYEFFERMGTIKNSNDLYFKDSIRLWNEMLDHPNYDQHWKDRNVLNHLENIKTPFLVTGGWYDAEDLYGAIKTYQALVSNNPETPGYFAMGPWVHGGWSSSDGDHLGDIDFGGKTAVYYREHIEFAFFKHYLKGSEFNLPKVSVFETGTNTWKSFDAWPPAESKKEKIYLLPDSKLSFEAPVRENTEDEYISDPEKAVPFTNSITTDMEREYMTEDQRFVSYRPDVLSYQSGILDQDITLAGNIEAELHVSTSGTDADWVVKVIDVYPDSAKNTKWTTLGEFMSGYQQMVRSEAMRGKYRNSFSAPVPFVPDQISPLKFELQDILHTFKKGHRIMVQIQSTWFPLIDRNPQQFLNIMKAKASDFRKARNKVYTSKSSPSFLNVRVLN